MNMELDKLPADIWREISKNLTKSDLIALQFVNQRLLTCLDKIPDIWWGKHNSDYRKHWNEYYNNVPKTEQDKSLEKLSRMYNRHCAKCYEGPGVKTIKGLIASSEENIGKCHLQMRMRRGGQDLARIHVSGCFDCNYCSY